MKAHYLISYVKENMAVKVGYKYEHHGLISSLTAGIK